MSLVPPGRAARPEAASSVAPRLTSLGALVRRKAPSAIASERPSHPGDEASSCWSLLEQVDVDLGLGQPAAALPLTA
jgi:hypothetical protein